METKVIESKKGSLSSRDFLRGLGIAVGTAVIGLIVQVLEAGSLDFNWKEIAIAGLSAGAVYVGKNWFLEPPKTIVTTSNNSDLTSVTKDIKDVV